MTVVPFAVIAALRIQVFVLYERRFTHFVSVYAKQYHQVLIAKAAALRCQSDFIKRFLQFVA